MISNITISVITVHFQDFSSLWETLISIQPFIKRIDVEWIVIDGGSDATSPSDQEILRQVKQDADIFLSEPDTGIYDAMNKGIVHACGKYFQFLNAGDKYHESFSPDVLISKTDTPAPDMIWGNTNCQYVDGTFGVKKRRGPKWIAYGMPVCHQSVFFLSKRFATMKYDTKYQIAADYDLLARALKSGAKVHLMDETISEFSAGGISQRNKWRSLREESQVRVANFGVPSLVSNLFSAVRLGMWKLNDFSPSFNRFWRKIV